MGSPLGPQSEQQVGTWQPLAHGDSALGFRGQTYKPSSSANVGLSQVLLICK